MSDHCVVAVAGERSERLLADGLLQHRVVGRVRAAVVSAPASAEASWVMASQRPAKNASYIVSMRSNTSGWKSDAAGAEACRPSVQLMGGALGDADGGAVQVLQLASRRHRGSPRSPGRRRNSPAPGSGRARRRAGRSGWSCGYSTSISPVCSAVKRACAVSGTKRTLAGVAEHRGGQRRGSSRRRGRCNSPRLSGAEKPAKPCDTPQTSCRAA